MSILETFYILFKSDASDVKKGAEDAEKSTKKLNDSLNSVNKSSEKVGASFLQMAKAAAIFIGAGAAAYSVLHNILGTADYTAELGNTSKALGVNVSELDAWGSAVERVGGTARGFQQSLKSLSEHFGTSANIALKTLPQIADVFQRLGRLRAFQYGKALGLDESTILLLQQGRREVESVINRQKELGVVNQKDIEISRAYKIATFELGISFRQLALTTSETLLPIFTKIVNAITPIVQYIISHKDLIVGAFIGIGIAATIMLAPFIAANAAILLTAAVIAGLIAVVAIAYEDIKAYTEGHISLTGDLIKRWSSAKNIVTDSISAITKALNAMLSPLKTGIELFEKLFSGGNKKVSLDIQNGQQLLSVATKNPISSQSSNSIFTSQAFARNQSINTGPITINTQATDALGISKDIGKGIQYHLGQANNEFADGVSY